MTLVDDACAALEEPRYARAIDAVGGHYCRVRTTDQMLAEFAGAAASGDQMQAQRHKRFV